MKFIKIILFALSTLAVDLALAEEAAPPNDHEISFVDTLIDNELYFKVGGGLAEFNGHQGPKMNDITSLKYSIGIATQPLNFELGYRNISDGNNYNMHGIDIYTKHDWSLSRDVGVFLGAGGYFYQSEMNNPSNKSSFTTSGIAPYLSIGSRYALSEFIDVSIQFDQMFNVDFVDPYINKTETKQMRQISLSFVLHPWSGNKYEAKPIQNIQEVSFEQQVDLAENSGIYRYDVAELEPTMKSQLLQLVSRIERLETYDIRVTGGADSKPMYLSHNTDLAQRRAIAVADFLIQHGIQKDYIQIEVMVTENEEDDPSARKVEITVHGTEILPSL